MSQTERSILKTDLTLSGIHFSTLKMSLRFRIIQLKRNKFAKITIGTIIILLLLLALFRRSENLHNSSEFTYSRNSKFSRQVCTYNIFKRIQKYSITIYLLNFQIPVFRDDILGNFEYPTSTNKPGPGEKGEPHHIPSSRENEALQSLSEYGMNMACSDDISLNRTIPDLRMDE